MMIVVSVLALMASAFDVGNWVGMGEKDMPAPVYKYTQGYSDCVTVSPTRDAVGGYTHLCR